MTAIIYFVKNRCFIRYNSVLLQSLHMSRTQILIILRTIVFLTSFTLSGSLFPYISLLKS